MIKTILVSAHHDDVALSIGAMVALGIIKRPMLLATVFSKSAFAPNLTFSHSIEEVTSIRFKEDSRFASFIGAKRINFGLKDAPIRFPNVAFETLVTNANVDQSLVPKISLQIQKLVTANDCSTLLIPFGYGGHTDHLTVRAACEEVDACEILYYLDQPYAGLLPRNFKIPGFTCIFSLELDEKISSLKLKIAEFYPSQPAADKMARLLTAYASKYIIESLWKFGRSPTSC